VASVSSVVKRILCLALNLVSAGVDVIHVFS
jgi:hypothetical protein